MTENRIEIKQADRSNFCETSLDSFDRFQAVHNVWRMENGSLVLKFQPFTETWSPEQRRKKARQILSGRYVTFCAFEADAVVGEIMLLRELKERTASRWLFPSPVKEDVPIDPQSVYRKMKKALVRANCKNIRFHDLRHTFATMALEHGMDVKTLSSVIGHISSTTTVDIYSHVTGAMQTQAAQKIDAGIGRAREPADGGLSGLPAVPGPLPQPEPFAPYKGKIRKPGTGGIYEINDHLFEGRYSPTNAQGKREVHTVYAKTREECEALLEKMITEVREQIKEEKRKVSDRSNLAGV